MATENRPRNLDPSALGTKRYWDEAYSVEIQNHSANPEDEGTIWFDDSGAEEKMVEYLETLELNMQEDPTPAIDREDISILDLGTGNGHLLFSLRDDGWQAQLVGVDYSQSSVDLADQIQEARAKDDNISFHRWDILNDPPSSWLPQDGFDILLDKGTFDAISLSDHVDDNGARVFESYARKVAPLMRKGGYLLITSCNWTEEELRHWFEGVDLEYHGTVKFPSFTFGGVTGQTVSSVCFRHKE